MSRRLRTLLLLNLVFSLVAIGWLTWLTVEPRRWFDDAYAASNVSDQTAYTDLQSQIEEVDTTDLEARISDLEDSAQDADTTDLEARISELEDSAPDVDVSELESRLSDTESNLEDLCSALSSSDLEALADAALGAC